MSLTRSQDVAFFDTCTAKAQTLLLAAQSAAHENSGVRVLSFSVQSLVARLQAELWKELVLVAQAPHRAYFALGQDLLGDLKSESVDELSVYDTLDLINTRLTSAGQGHLVTIPGGAIEQFHFTRSIPMPKQHELDAARKDWLGDRSPKNYISYEHETSRELMLKAHSLALAGQIDEAVACVYDSDFAALGAYLVDSACSAGDSELITAYARWELVSASVAKLESLPADFSAAVSVIRRAFAIGLGEPEASRLLASLSPI